MLIFDPRLPGTLPEFGPFTSVRCDVARPGDRPISWIARLYGAPVMLAFIGGSLAWELSRAGPAAAEAHARERDGACVASARGVLLGPRISRGCRLSSTRTTASG
jgi:monoamine oxidase